MAGKRLVLMPGAYDALSARIIEAEGFQALVAGGYAGVGSMLRFCVTPRTKRPRRVLASSSQMPASTAKANATMTILFHGSTTSANASIPPDMFVALQL